MGLKRITRVHRMYQFHPSIWKCIRDISYEAYEEIFHRELSSRDREEDMRIRIDESEYTTERLGIMQVHVSISKLGQRINVWTFAHLTIQEHMAAVYLSDMNWLKECVIVRFLVALMKCSPCTRWSCDSSVASWKIELPVSFLISVITSRQIQCH